MLKEIKGADDVITTADLFSEIISVVKESGEWPESFINYALPIGHTGLYNYEFIPVFYIERGINEHIYFELCIKGKYGLNTKNGMLRFGVIETSYEGSGAIRKMSALSAECLIAYEKIMDNNIDAFNRIGCSLHFLDSEGKHTREGYVTLKNEEDALEVFRRLNKYDSDMYHKAIIRNNLTREEQIYERKEI